MTGRTAAAGGWLLVPIALLAALVGVASAVAPLLALGAAAALLILGLVLADATTLLLVLVAAFPWDDALPYPSQTVSVIKILGALLLVGYLLRALARSEPVLVPPTLLPLTIFTIVMLLSLAVSDDIGEGLAKAVRYLLFAAFFFMFVQLVRTRVQFLLVMRVLTLSATAAAVVGLAGFLTGAVTRASGPIGEANDFAFLLATVIPLAVYLARYDGARRGLWGACVFMLAATVLATLSRGALVGLLALGLWAVGTGRLRVGGLLAGAVVVLGIGALAALFWGPLISERLTEKGVIANQNVASRKALWGGAVRMAADNPLLGVGTGQYGVRSSQYVHNEPLGIRRPVAHNSYLEVLAEDGVIAFGALIAFLTGSWRLLALARRYAVEHGDEQGARLATATQASLIVAIVAANFLSVQITVPLWLLGAMAAGAGAGRVRVVLVTSIPAGGPVEHARLLARELVLAGVSVRAVVCDEALAARFAAVGAEPRVLPLRPGLDVAGAREVARACRGADVVHNHDPRSGLWARLSPPPRRGGVIVHSLHGLPEPYLPPPAGPARPSVRAALLYGGVERGLAARADALVVPSRAAADALAARLHYPRERLHVVANGVDPAPAVPDGGGSLVGTIAALEPVKGLDVFLRAAAEVRRARPSQRFAIAGDGPLAAPLRALVCELGLAGAVELWGYVPSAEALPRLAVFALASHFETSGIALLEAMAAGVPAVATRVGGIPESVPDGTAELVDAGDAGALAGAILRALDDPAAARRRALRAREIVAREFTPQRTARAMTRIYERALGGRR
jgi:glycosyltransferase involved in cell wall biosynthesis/O-antigen ligase